MLLFLVNVPNITTENKSQSITFFGGGQGKFIAQHMHMFLESSKHLKAFASPLSKAAELFLISNSLDQYCSRNIGSLIKPPGDV